MSEQHMLGITDFVVLGASLIVCAFIGLYFGKRDKADTVASYLLANRKMNFIPVAFSILATIMSALGMSGGIGEMYLYGFEYQLLTLFTCFGKLFVAYFIMPVFHQMQYVSVYEYLERRYDKTMRVVFSLIYLITNIIYLGIVLYVPALSLTTVTGVPYIATSCVTGVICIFYCVAGGYKAVIWTDVLQSFLMFSCFGLLIIKCMTKSGGLISAIENTYNGGRLHINFVETEETRYSFWSLAFAGAIMSIKNFNTNQAGIQRLLSVKNVKVATRSLLLSIVLTLVFKGLLLFAGFAIYDEFKDCDPLSDPSTNVTSLDQILVYAVVVMLGSIPGLAGVALSGILSGSLSTLSSYINAFAALTLEDYLKPLFPKFTSNEKKNIIVCKFLSIGIYYQN